MNNTITDNVATGINILIAKSSRKSDSRTNIISNASIAIAYVPIR